MKGNLWKLVILERDRKKADKCRNKNGLGDNCRPISDGIMTQCSFYGYCNQEKEQSQ